jgi:hypothetical protein
MKTAAIGRGVKTNANPGRFPQVTASRLEPPVAPPPIGQPDTILAGVVVRVQNAAERIHSIRRRQVENADRVIGEQSIEPGDANMRILEPPSGLAHRAHYEITQLEDIIADLEQQVARLDAL